MSYLQQHGFDKALATFKAGIADEHAGDGNDESREAIFRAPGPVAIESTLKRNIPQAQAISASALSERITPDFEAQAKYIIEQMQKKFGAAAQGDGDDEVAGNQDSLLDPSDRTEGYRRFRRWVDQGLDLWKVCMVLLEQISSLKFKPELDALAYPLFVHTFLDLMSFGFTRAGKSILHSACHVDLCAQLGGFSRRTAPHTLSDILKISLLWPAFTTDSMF